MENKIIIAFETLTKSHEVLKKVQQNFYPAGTYWLLAFSNGASLLYLKEDNRLESINNSLYGKADFVLLKDDVLTEEQINILSKIIGEREMYVIHHFNNNSPYIRERNDQSFSSHVQLSTKYKFSISQSHLEGYFYFDELVEILKCVQSDIANKGSRYNDFLQNVIERRFPNPILEAKLELLHKCLDFEDAERSHLDDLLRDEFAVAFNTFKLGLTSENHIERLTIFRDVLLQS